MCVCVGGGGFCCWGGWGGIGGCRARGDSEGRGRGAVGAGQGAVWGGLGGGRVRRGP